MQLLLNEGISSLIFDSVFKSLIIHKKVVLKAWVKDKKVHDCYNFGHVVYSCVFTLENIE